MTDMEVKSHLDDLFFVESIGVSDVHVQSDSNSEQIDQFCAGIELKDNRYYVELPWYL